MGLGRVFRRTYRCRRPSCAPCVAGEAAHTCRTWSIDYWIHDERGALVKRREQAHTTDRRLAEELLRRRLEQAGQGLPAAPRAEKVAFEDLVRLITASYETRRQDVRRLRVSLRHLTDAFRANPARAVTGSRVEEYKADRLRQGAAPATVNRELAVLKRMYRLAARNRLILHDHVPAIELLPEDNIRHGVILPWQMQELLAALPPRVRPIAELTYITGWRARSDVLTRRWEHVRWAEGVLMLESGEGKAKRARKFPLIPRLRAILEEQRAWTDAEEARSGSAIPWVFHHRGGRPIRYYRRAWIRAAAVVATRHPEWGAEKWIRHDMRRSAVENLLSAGVAEADILKMVGMSHATFLRYHQLHAGRLAQAGARLHDFLGRSRTEPGSNVVPLREA